MKPWKRALVTTASLALSGCGELPPPSDSARTAIPAASLPGPVAVLGRIEPIDCDNLVVGIIDYVGGATGVSDIVAETLTTEAVAHDPGDQIVVDGNRTAIVRGGRTLYIAEWRQSDAGGWLLTQTQACQAPLSESPGPEE